MFPRSLFLVIAAVVCSSVTARAQQARVFGGSDKIAIEKMYDRYLQAFIKKDYVALRESFQAPFVMDPKSWTQKWPFLRWSAALKMKESQCHERERVTHPA